MIAKIRVSKAIEFKGLQYSLASVGCLLFLFTGMFSLMGVMISSNQRVLREKLVDSSPPGVPEEGEMGSGGGTIGSSPPSVVESPPEEGEMGSGGGTVRSSPPSVVGSPLEEGEIGSGGRTVRSSPTSVASGVTTGGGGEGFRWRHCQLKAC